MKGVIFNVFENFVVSKFGDAAWEAILEKAGHAHAAWVGPGTYPDAHLLEVAKTAAEIAGLPLDVAVHAFGTFLFQGLISRFPAVVAPFKDARSLLFGIDSVIHVEVNKLMPASVTPKIICSDLPDGRIALEYTSRRQLCGLMEGLLEGMGQHYGTPITFEKVSCVHQGAPICRYVVTVAEARQAA